MSVFAWALEPGPTRSRRRWPPRLRPRARRPRLSRLWICLGRLESFHPLRPRHEVRRRGRSSKSRSARQSATALRRTAASMCRPPVRSTRSAAPRSAAELGAAAGALLRGDPGAPFPRNLRRGVDFPAPLVMLDAGRASGCSSCFMWPTGAFRISAPVSDGLSTGSAAARPARSRSSPPPPATPAARSAAPPRGGRACARSSSIRAAGFRPSSSTSCAAGARR